ncbi:MAG: DUF1624 domain-containing protein [Verrucomicrobia bacterium]|nr:DUF1624 domain-containing protein [Verrucomicrobiota bacterium]
MNRQSFDNKQRIIGYDLARALAVFGMVLVNYRIVMAADMQDPSWLAKSIGFIEGRASALFVVLAGMGISLLSHEARNAGDKNSRFLNRVTLLKRAAFLFVVGIFYTPIWPADILHFYGVYIALASLLMFLPSKWLSTVAVVFVVAFPLLCLGFDYERRWDWETLHYSGLWTLPGMISHLFFNGFHPVVPWLAFLLIGMILGRLNLTDSAVRIRVFLFGICITIFAEGASWILIENYSGEGYFANEGLVEACFGTSPMPPMPLYMLAATGTACVVIGIAVAVGEKWSGAAWLRPLIVTGQASLTLYVAHVVIGFGLLEAIGHLENQSLEFATGSAVVFCFIGMILACLWRRRFERGPLEAVMRRIT